MKQPSAKHILQTNTDQAMALLRDVSDFASCIEQAGQLIRDALLAGQKLLCCGNGGSAADCAHLTAEFAGRYIESRRGYCAIDLTANHSLTTALINDFLPEDVFARQVVAMGLPGDVLLVLSTSGNSENIKRALRTAKQGKLSTIALLGRDGGRCKGLADVEMIVPSQVTARIQEVHQLLYHSICDWVEPELMQGNNE